MRCRLALLIFVASDPKRTSTQCGRGVLGRTQNLDGIERECLRAVCPQRLFAHRLACQRAMAMPPDTTAVIVGSAHCGAKWEGCANTSPMNVAIALIVACREALSIVRSICARRETATAALTIPQTEARNACSKLNAAKTFPRAITRKQASHAPPNFSAAGRANPRVRNSTKASRTLSLRLRIDRPFPPWLPRRLFSCAIRRQ
jgi:hypothetical protein